MCDDVRKCKYQTRRVRVCALARVQSTQNNHTTNNTKKDWPCWWLAAAAADGARVAHVISVRRISGAYWWRVDLDGQCVWRLIEFDWE